MKRRILAALFLSTIIIVYFVVNYSVAVYSFSYGFMKGNFENSQHYKELLEYQQKWNVPVWVGEFAYTGGAQGIAAALRGIFDQLYGTRYLMEQTAVDVVNGTGWGWCHWEYEKASFTDDRLNGLINPYFKGVWKPTEPIPKLVIVGSSINTENGQSVLLKGDNVELKHLEVYGWLEPTPALFEKFNNMGLNVIRLVIDPEDLTPQQGVWSEEAFRTLNDTLNLAEQYGIYVDVDLHQYKSSSFWKGGYGFPKWYVERYNFTQSDADMERFTRMWTYKQHPFEDSWDFLASCWSKILEVTNHRNIVFGYDLFNELDSNTVAIYEYLSSVIYPLDDAQKMQFVDTPMLFDDMAKKNITDKPSVHNMVLSPHFYSAWSPSYLTYNEGVITTTVIFPLVPTATVFTLKFRRRYRLQKRNKMASIRS